MINPQDIKAGAQFVVTVSAKGAWIGPNQYGFVRVDNEDGTEPVHVSCLSPLPAPSPTAEIDAEIVEVVDNAKSDNGVRFNSAHLVCLINLIDRRRAMLKPKDAVGELLEAVNGLIAKIGHAKMREVDAFLEAAARVRKERGE